MFHGDCPLIAWPPQMNTSTSLTNLLPQVWRSVGAKPAVEVATLGWTECIVSRNDVPDTCRHVVGAAQTWSTSSIWSKNLFYQMSFISTLITFSTSAGLPKGSPGRVLAKNFSVSRLAYVISRFWGHFRHRPVPKTVTRSSTSQHFLLTITFDPLLGLTSG